MRILVIGGTGFIGPPLVRQLARQGHEVTVVTRGGAGDLPAAYLRADRDSLASLEIEADVVIDLILSSGRQAEALMRAFRGRAARVVAASSMDVYRACGVLHGSEPGPLEPVPLTEESPLRTVHQTYPPERIRALREIFPWLDEEYDKIPVERAVLSEPALPGTVLRLPMIYGPGDRLHRFHPYVRRMEDGRPFILFEGGWAAWRSPRGYIENVAAALALAAVSPRSAGCVYNVAEQPAFSELEWARKIGDAFGWPGRLIVLPRDRVPPSLVATGNTAQHWEADSSRIRRELGYREPVPVAEAIRRTIEWERANPPSGFGPFDYTAEDAAAGITSPPLSDRRAPRSF